MKTKCFLKFIFSLRSLPAIATDLAGIVHTKHRDLPAIAMCGGIVAYPASVALAGGWQAGLRILR